MPSGTTIPNTFVTAYSGRKAGSRSRRWTRKANPKQSPLRKVKRTGRK